MAAVWYYSKGEAQFGPITSEQLKQLAAGGEVAAVDLIWKEGMPDWVPASRVKGLFPGAAPAAHAPGAAAPAVAGAEHAPVVPQPAAYAAPQPHEAREISYYNPTGGLGQRAARTLAGFPVATGAKDEWPLSDHHLNQVAIAGQWRALIRNCGMLFYVLMIFQGFTVLIMLFQMIMMARMFKEMGGPSMPPAFFVSQALGMLVMAGIGVLLYLCAKATLKCRSWGLITMIVLFGLSIVFLILVGIGLAAIFGRSAISGLSIMSLLYIVMAALPGYFIWMCVRALGAIPKFLASPVWTQEALVKGGA